MIERQNYIPEMKRILLDHLHDLTNKIKTEEAFPHGNLDLDKLGEIDDEIDNILNNWYY